MNINRLILIIMTLTAAGTNSAQQPATGDSYRAMLDQYCVSCHNEALKTAGLMLDQANIQDVSEDPALWERVITKLTLRAMPPVGIPFRPSEDEYEGLLSYLHTELGELAKQRPDPGRPTVHRLNRTEYANAIRDLLALEIDTTALLPADNLGGGFDNIAEILSVSPLLMERYMFAAGRISRMAIGPQTAQPASEQYEVEANYRQKARMSDDLPFGSRGGTTIQHFFPQDGEYTVKIELERNIEGYIRGIRNRHTIDVRLDNKRIGTRDIGGEVLGRSGPIFTENQVVHYSGDPQQVGYEFSADENLVFRFPATAGMHQLGVTFFENRTKPTGILQPELPLADIASYKGGDMEVGFVTITGPYNAKGPGETPSRKKIFVCQPVSDNDDACAETILSRLARQAYRRPVRDDEIAELIRLFQEGRRGEGNFETGIELALQSILAGPEFLFRIEQDPPGASPGDVYAVNDLELASRLSFFLWSSLPDEDLISIAERGELRSPGMLEKQVRRMLADPRSKAFVKNFASLWLGFRNIDNADPNQEIFPQFDEELRQAFKQELLLWFESMVREDKSILELLTSDYTYVNERLARHYGIPGIYGARFRPVQLAGNESRQGLFGKGGLLMGTAFNNRTSPVVRGKWVLENLLNMPPPPPPDDVPALQVEDDTGKALTLKQAMEKHRANPVCSSCHKLMDPIGLALENFDAIGTYRARYDEADADVDASGILFDGNEFQDIDQFLQEFLDHSDRIAHTMTEKVLTYALGRELAYSDQPYVRDIVNRIKMQNFTWSSLILGVIESTPFQYRRVKNHDDI